MSEFSALRNGTAFNSCRISKTTKEYERSEAKERKRNILYLIVSYLHEHNLHESADVLANEAQLSSQFEVCDNIDLDIMYQDYESFYITKFNKSPKIVKKSNQELKQTELNQHRKKSKGGNVQAANGNGNCSVQGKTTLASTKQSASDFQIDVTSLSQKSNEINGNPVSLTNVTPDDNYLSDEKPLCNFEGYTSEWREMADVVVREFVPKNLGLSWKDCIGVDSAIESLKEAVVYPMRFPFLFNGILSPWRGILLYGPPGTGKTLLAKALAGETSTRFINVSSSSFISKWRGESEKMIKVLFDVARFYAPTTIFIDEVDALASKFDENQHDASRRFKSELLIQLDGVLGGSDQIFVLASTNSPWNLDSALLRRFEKRILLPLPEKKCRAELFKYFLRANSNSLQEEDFSYLADVTEKCSCCDIKLICKEAAMHNIRDIISELTLSQNKTRDIFHRKISVKNILNAIDTMKPAMDPSVQLKYIEWAKKFGCV